MTTVPPTPERTVRASASDELLAVAIRLFASKGFTGTSLQQIADAAGYSKSNVLYHFASKEALLETALEPVIARLEVVLASVGAEDQTVAQRHELVEQFIDFLLEYRLEVHTFINQGQSLSGLPVVERANALIRDFAVSVQTDLSTVTDQVRFGVALGGAAYALVASQTFGVDEPDAEMRDALVDVVDSLLAPVRRRNAAKRTKN